MVKGKVIKTKDGSKQREEMSVTVCAFCQIRRGSYILAIDGKPACYPCYQEHAKK